MKVTKVNHITGGQAVDYIRSGGTLYFPDGFGMKSLEYHWGGKFLYFVNYEGQHIRTNWNEAHIANRVWEIEREI